MQTIDGALAAAAAAFTAGNVELALRQYDIVLAIDPEHAAAKAGRARAERLPEVLSIVSRADGERTRGELKQALGSYGEALKVAVQAPPVDGKANAALEEALAEWLGLKRSQVELKAGASSRDKTFAVVGMDAQTARDRLASHFPPA